MTRENAMYIGIFGLMVCILNLARPYLFSIFSFFRKRFYANSLFQKYHSKLEKIMISKGASREEMYDFQSFYYGAFWLVGFFIFFAVLYTQNYFLLIFLATYPYYIYRKVRVDFDKRNEEMTKTFPYFLDMLILCLESGMDTLRSIKEIVRTNPKDPLHQEFTWIMHTTEVGQTLSKATYEAGQRSQNEQLQFFASALAQSSELGSSLSEVLRRHAETLRESIFRKAQEEARKVPVKILFPLIFCIFPVVFIILFVPIAINLLGLM